MNYNNNLDDVEKSILIAMLPRTKLFSPPMCISFASYLLRAKEALVAI